jgi:hypothetical protein
MNKKILKLLSSSLAIASLVFIALPIKAHAQTNQITVTTSQGCIASVSPSTISILSGSSLNLSVFNGSTTNDISVSGAASGNIGYDSKMQGTYPSILNLSLGAITQTETINFTPFPDTDKAIVSDYCTGNGSPATLTITPYTPAPAPISNPAPTTSTRQNSPTTSSNPAPTTTAPSTTTPVKPLAPNASNINVQSQSTSTQQKPKNNYNWMYVFMIIPIAMIVLGVYIIRKAIKGSKSKKTTNKNKKPKK